MDNNSSIYNKAINRIASIIANHEGKVLVTGASGLIGTCIIDALVEANRSYNSNFQIYALGRNSSKLEKFDRYDSVIIVAQSITDPILVDDIDYIIHAASNADPRSYALYPVETIQTNVLGAINVLDYCKKHKNTRALLTSTFEVYGKLDIDVYSENDYGVIDLNMIRSCYPESKRTSEMMFKCYADEFGINCVIARLASIYGPTMQKDDSKAHAQFLRNALLGNNIVLKSEGTQRRTYCYVMDAVSGIFTVLFNGLTGEAYNIANENSIATIAELAHTIADIVGTKVVFDLPDEIEGKGFSKPQNCVLDNHKLKSLGWEGKYDLKSGISETLDILRELGVSEYY